MEESNKSKIIDQKELERLRYELKKDLINLIHNPKASEKTRELLTEALRDFIT